MQLHDVIDRAELIDSVLDYCDSLIHVLTGRTDLIQSRRVRSRTFNAKVETVDGRTYTLLLHDGLVDRLRSALERLQSEALDDEMRATAELLLGDPGRVDICHRVWLVQSIVFVVLHEVAHVVCGHLGWWRLVMGGDRGTAFHYDEVDGLPEPAPADAGDTRQWRWLMELEADEVALDRMLALAHEIFCADEEAGQLIQPGPDPEAVQPAQRRAAEALTFYAACTAMALIEAQQSGSTDHPPAVARLHHLVNTYVRRLLSGNEGPAGVVRLALTPARRQVLADVAAPALVQAMDIVQACCEATGVGMAERYGGAADSVARRLTTDLVGLLTDQPEDTLSAEARVYRGLRGAFPSLHLRTAAHRLPGG